MEVPSKSKKVSGGSRPQRQETEAQPGWARSETLQLPILPKLALGVLGKGNQNFHLSSCDRSQAWAEVGKLGGE